MPNDGFTLMTICQELNKYLNNGKVNKITQPDSQEIILQIYANGKTHRLLICVSAENSRMHLTNAQKENPTVPPTFCMMLRKHLVGAVIKSFETVEMDRIIKITFSTLSEMHDSEDKLLIVEIMGKHSNIILTNSELKIIGAIKNVSFDTSSVRQILPNLMYAPAQTQNKLYILDKEPIMAELVGFSGDLIKKLVSLIKGISSQFATEAVHLSCLTPNVDNLTSVAADKLMSVIQGMYHRAFSLELSPVTSVKDFFPFEYHYLNVETKSYQTLNEALDHFFAQRDSDRIFAGISHSLHASLKQSISRTEKALAKCSGNIDSSRDYEEQKKLGDIITANLYKIKKGDKSILAQNFYDEQSSDIKIVLDENLSPSQNAQRYYKRYAKQKKTFEINIKMRNELAARIEYLNTIETSFMLSKTALELNDIKNEMVAAGIITQAKTKKKVEMKVSSVQKLIYNGYTIFVGKNNAQNEQLTKGADGADIWLHTKTVHGSHVIIKTDGTNVPESVIEYAASLAAYYSKARFSDKVEVDYTERRFVKKPPKTPLGMVTYTSQKTILVKPANVEAL